MENEFYKAFEKCSDLIKSWIRDYPTFYIHNIGNWGDGIIRSASLNFLDINNIKYTEIFSLSDIYQNPELFTDSVLIYQGSGAFCKLWDHSATIKQLSEVFKKIIILPSTFEISFSIPNVYSFCRDFYESKINMPDAIFCHDIAFSMNISDYKDNKGEGIGYFFRTDIESSGQIMINSKNKDISLEGNHMSDPDGFISAISDFKIIFTDRLHVAIIATILDKIVHFYPGSYFKNRAVYNSSMKEFFPNVFFHEF
jgi:exopolysaccharide biosynthesis predicted pyruvyltransferase EpsI